MRKASDAQAYILNIIKDVVTMMNVSAVFAT